MGPLSRANLPYQRALAVNYSTNGYPTLVPTVTKPTGAGVFQSADSGTGISTMQGIEAMFFGAGSDDNTFKAMLIGWKATTGVTGVVWIPIPILEVTCTLGSMTGVAATDMLSTDLVVDTLVLSAGFPTGDTSGVQITSPTGNIAAHLLAPIQGFGTMQWAFATGGIATNCNAMFCYW